GISRAAMAGPGVYRGTAVGAVWRRRVGRCVLADDAGAGGGGMLGVALAPGVAVPARRPPRASQSTLAFERRTISSQRGTSCLMNAANAATSIPATLAEPISASLAATSG